MADIMARMRTGMGAVLVVLGLVLGSAGIAHAQDSGGAINVTQGNGTSSSQDNDEDDTQTETQVQDLGGGGEDSLVDGAPVGQSQSQDSSTDQGNASGVEQDNSVGVSDIGGDDVSSDDDTASVTGSGNGDPEVITALIAILLSILAGPDLS